MEDHLERMGDHLQHVGDHLHHDDDSIGLSPSKRAFHGQPNFVGGGLLYLMRAGADDLILCILQQLDTVHIHRLRIACGAINDPRGARLDARDSLFHALCSHLKSVKNGSSVWHNMPSR
jgi:hypothetical protein